ncbi:MAG: beta-ketoacyl synthase [Cyclobacteriaceae bacterium]|nr:beta-ketoacyl synthase [Cyclobacteriaceae bacterium]
MSTVWIAADGVVSPLGRTTDATYQKIRNGKTGIREINDRALLPIPFFAGKMEDSDIGDSPGLSRFEKICWEAMRQATLGIALAPERTLFILSTTKGNISFLEQGRSTDPRLALHATSRYLASMAGIRDQMVVSNACVSGVMAMIVAKRFLESGKYDHALVVGADVLSQFVVSGFNCLQAISPLPCKPFDRKRSGVNLGEAAAAVILTTKPEQLGVTPFIKIVGGGLSNDANHISGPSRTGEELGNAISQALSEAHLETDNVDFISAHGTATRYNDEMEAKAFIGLGLNHTLTNSMKGYFGHTLGAAGVLETIMSAKSLQHNEVIATYGCEEPDNPPINVCLKPEKRMVNTCLKTASGFGGCNAAIILQKVN